MIRARASRPRRQLPDDVYADLIDIIYRSMSPLISMGVAVTAVGALLYSMTNDVAVVVLTAASLVVTLARIWLNVAYNKRRAGPALARAEVRRWELAFGIGAVMGAVLLGALNARAILVGDATVQVVVTGLMFGYCSGAVIRVSVRPLLVGLTVFAVAAPTIFGFAAHALNGGTPFASTYAVQAVMLTMFTLGCIEMANHLYRTTLEQVTTKSRLSHLARKDPLTGLANRLSLRERFDRDVVKLRRSGELIALHFLDLDRFKAVNDNRGHPTGDALLKMVAGRLTRALREGDTAARLGGDEFVILQTNIQEPGEAETLAHRIVREISAPYRIDGHDLYIGASVGIALAPKDGIDLDELAARADAALYQAKSTKRGTVGFWHDPKLIARGAA